MIWGEVLSYTGPLFYCCLQHTEKHANTLKVKAHKNTFSKYFVIKKMLEEKKAPRGDCTYFLMYLMTRKELRHPLNSSLAEL